MPSIAFSNQSYHSFSQRKYNDGTKRTRSRSPSPTGAEGSSSSSYRSKRPKTDDSYRPSSSSNRNFDDRHSLDRRRDERPRYDDRRRDVDGRRSYGRSDDY